MGLGVVLLAVGMLIVGSINTIVTKYQACASGCSMVLLLLV